MRKIAAIVIGLLPSLAFAFGLIREPIVAATVYLLIGIVAVGLATTRLPLRKQIGVAFGVACVLVLSWMSFIGPTPNDFGLLLFTIITWVFQWLPILFVLIVVSNAAYRYSFRYLHAALN